MCTAANRLYPEEFELFFTAVVFPHALQKAACCIDAYCNKTPTLSEFPCKQGGIQTPLFLNTPTFSSVKLYQNAILHIDEHTDVGETLLSGVLHQESALVLDGIGFAVQVVFIGETAV